MMRPGATIAAIIGGVFGLLASGAAAWMSWVVYEDREFDVPYFTVIYAIALFATSILLWAGIVSSGRSGAPPRPAMFIAAGVAGVAALASGSAFGFIGISSSGPPIFVLLFVLPPCAILLASASVATWFAKRGSP